MSSREVIGKVHDEFVNFLMLLGFEKLGSFEDNVCVKESPDIHKGWVCEEHELYKLTFLRNEDDVYVYITCIESDDSKRIGTSVLVKPNYIKYLLKVRCTMKFDEQVKINQCVDWYYKKLAHPSREINWRYLVENEPTPFTYTIFMDMIPSFISYCIDNETYENKNIKCMFNLKKML